MIGRVRFKIRSAYFRTASPAFFSLSLLVALSRCPGISDANETSERSGFNRPRSPRSLARIAIKRGVIVSRAFSRQFVNPGILLERRFIAEPIQEPTPGLSTRRASNPRAELSKNTPVKREKRLTGCMTDLHTVSAWSAVYAERHGFPVICKSCWTLGRASASLQPDGINDALRKSTYGRSERPLFDLSFPQPPKICELPWTELIPTFYPAREI